jgi:hypothetical protein
MGKAVKKIAGIAAVAALSFYGGQALSGYLSGGTALGGGFTSSLGTVGGAIHMGAGVAPGVGAGLFGAAAIQKLGTGLQTISYLQQRKYASAQAKAYKQQAEAQRQAQLAQERYRLVQERKQRFDIIRQQRYAQGSMEAQTGSSGLGLQGTSGFLGATGAIQTQATANLESINMASGASTAISRFNQKAADYQSQAYAASGMGEGWKQIGGLGDFMYKRGPEIFDMGKSIFEPFKIKTA